MSDDNLQLDGPFQVLPNETVADIFNHAIWMDTHSLSRERKHHLPTQVTPLTLGAVCRSWREFVWETPSLWSMIVLSLSENRYGAQNDILDMWLHNSKPYPLDIWFDVHCKLSLFDERITSVLQKFVNESRRWRKCSTLIASNLIGAISQVQGKVPLLQSLCLQWVEVERNDNNSPEGTNLRLEMFSDAPLLTKVTLLLRDHRQGHSCLTLPWRQLSSIRLTEYQEGQRNTLSKCINLVECEIAGSLYNYHKPPPNDLINFPHLHSLSIIEFYEFAPYIERNLKHIRCPNLRRLHLSTRTPRKISSQEIEEFITRSDCTLESLQLKLIDNPSSILPILEKLPSLKSLSVQVFTYRIDDNMCSFFDSMFAKLDLTNSTTFLPCLQELRYKVIPGPWPVNASSASARSLIYRNLLKVLRQRWNPPEGVSKLQVVIEGNILTIDNTVDRNVVDGLRELKRRGVQITVPGL